MNLASTRARSATRGRTDARALVTLCACLLSLPAWCGQSGLEPASAPALAGRAQDASNAEGWVLAAAADQSTLDLGGLEQRLVDTKAIGFLTKLSLKGKMDGFIKELRTAHTGADGLTLEQMRERYDLLVHNVLAMLEKKDQALAEEIAAAREPLWKLLGDAEKFEQALGGKA